LVYLKGIHLFKNYAKFSAKIRQPALLNPTLSLVSLTRLIEKRWIAAALWYIITIKSFFWA
jgi:hypothetical protein